MRCRALLTKDNIREQRAGERVCSQPHEVERAAGDPCDVGGARGGGEEEVRRHADREPGERRTEANDAVEERDQRERAQRRERDRIAVAADAEDPQVPRREADAEEAVEPEVRQEEQAAAADENAEEHRRAETPARRGGEAAGEEQPEAELEGAGLGAGLLDRGRRVDDARAVFLAVELAALRRARRRLEDLLD